MMRRFLISFTAAFVVAGLAVWGFITWTTYEPPIGGNFHLLFRNQPWSFETEAKKLNLLYVGYAKCPDVCPMTLSLAAQAFKKLPEKDRDRVRLLFLSVDRDNESPEDAANYAQQFNPNFVGLSGTREQIDTAVNQYHASYMLEKDPKSYLGYSIIHSDRLFFLDGKGRLVHTIPLPRSAKDIQQSIKEYL